jgi:hypothetical protein
MLQFIIFINFIINVFIKTPFWEICRIDLRIDLIENVKYRMDKFKYMHFKNKFAYVGNMTGKMFQFYSNTLM